MMQMSGRSTAITAIETRKSENFKFGRSIPDLLEGLTQYLSMWIDGPLTALQDKFDPVEIAPQIAEI
jgi:hypothetical protein